MEKQSIKKYIEELYTEEENLDIIKVKVFKKWKVLSYESICHMVDKTITNLNKEC